MPSKSMSGMRLCGSKPAWATVFVTHRLGRHDALACTDPAEPAHPLPATEHLLFDQHPLLAVGVDDDLGCPVAECRVNIVVPQGERLEYVAVGIDDIVSTGHDLLLGLVEIPSL